MSGITESLDVGEPITLRAQWFNDMNQLTDPSAGSLVVTKPSGAQITIDLTGLTHESVGTYRYVYVTDLPGVFDYTFSGVVEGMLSEQTGVFLVGVDVGITTPWEPWTTWDLVTAEPALALSGADVASITPRQQDLIIDSVSELLFSFSDMEFPGITRTTRSLCVRCSGCGSFWWWGDYGIGMAGVCTTCSPNARIGLRGRYPILGIRSVIIDGVALSPSAYRLEDQADLVRIDGGVWPVGHDLTDPSAFQATWVMGVPIPAAGRRAATMMAAEAALAALMQPCLLPQYRVRQVQADRTGFQPADQWLDSIDKGVPTPPGMFDPGHVGTIAHQMEQTP